MQKFNLIPQVSCKILRFKESFTLMVGNKCNRVKGHGIIYPNDVNKKLIYNIKNVCIG